MYLLNFLFSIFALFNDLPLETQSLLQELETKHHVLETGSDSLRVKYVTAQAYIEQMLITKQAAGEIQDLVGIIHTPLPATPLCVTEDPIKMSLSRAQIIRHYLAQGNKLLVAYPQNGLLKRKPEEQQIYQNLLVQYPENLIDWPMLAEEMEPDMIGATYFFEDEEGIPHFFSIKSRQVNDIQPQAEWGLWFGPLTDLELSHDRVRTILDYLASHGEKPLEL